LAILLGRLFYFLLGTISKKSVALTKSIVLYKFAIIIRYFLLILANVFNIIAFFSTGEFIYLLISIMLLVLNFAYKAGIMGFSKDFKPTLVTVENKNLSELI